MCCFSGPVRDVSQTRIFARAGDRGRQYLVYQMAYEAQKPVAMILPLPIHLPAHENAVRFIDLKQYTSFFDDLGLLFIPPETSHGKVIASAAAPGAAGGPMPLTVYEVGDFVASFVPAQADFHRLDPRFVISPRVWAKIPAYHDYGFAVFQLRAAVSQPKQVHPIAFEFETRLSDDTLFFPTVHIHDGEVHPVEQFDHVLYYQYPDRPWFASLAARPRPGSLETKQEANAYYDYQAAYLMPREHVNIAAAKGVIDSRCTVARTLRRGRLPNRDVFVSTRG